MTRGWRKSVSRVAADKSNKKPLQVIVSFLYKITFYEKETLCYPASVVTSLHLVFFLSLFLFFQKMTLADIIISSVSCICCYWMCGSKSRKPAADYFLLNNFWGFFSNKNGKMKKIVFGCFWLFLWTQTSYRNVLYLILNLETHLIWFILCIFVKKQCYISYNSKCLCHFFVTAVSTFFNYS